MSNFLIYCIFWKGRIGHLPVLFLDGWLAFRTTCLVIWWTAVWWVPLYQMVFLTFHQDFMFKILQTQKRHHSFIWSVWCHLFSVAFWLCQIFTLHLPVWNEPECTQKAQAWGRVEPPLDNYVSPTLRQDNQRTKVIKAQNKVSRAKAPQGLDHCQWVMGRAQSPSSSLHVHLV